MDADNLRCRRDERRVTEVGTGLWQLFENFVKTVERILLRKLRTKIGNHAARNRMDQHTRIYSFDFCRRLRFALSLQSLEICVDLA